MEGADFRSADIYRDGAEVQLSLRRSGDEVAPPTVGDANRWERVDRVENDPGGGLG